MENILKFEPIYKERVWGGRSIETIYERRLPKAELKYESHGRLLIVQEIRVK